MQSKIQLSSTNLDVNFHIKMSSTDSKYLSDFEAILENYLEEEKKVVALNSGTSAIHLALILSGVKKGDEVLCQTFTYIASVNPIMYQQATPIFIDSENDTWNMCPLSLEKAIKDRELKGKKPKAIIFVNIYGMPAKIDEIQKIAKKYNITLIEDAAEALGSEYNGKKCGTFGDFSILSFNNNKIISTLGGGALICKNEDEKQKAVFYATQSKEKDNYYEHKEIGFNYRMNSLAAILGIFQMDSIEKRILQRKKIHSYYEKELHRIQGISLFSENTKKYSSNHWLSCICFDEMLISKEEVFSKLNKDNIETRFLWKPIHLQKIYEKFPFYGGNVAKSLFDKGLCLPSGNNITNRDLKNISSTIKKLL